MTEWKQVGYLKTSDAGPFETHTWRYHLTLPRPLADWDVWDYWERPRTEHMASILKPGMVLYDVGAEFAWLSCIYATMVGPGNMVLVEPSTAMWPNIRSTWFRNCDTTPLATYHGLLGPTIGDIPAGHFETDGWPDAVIGELIDKTAYTYLHDNPTAVPSTTLDALVTRVGRAPDAVTMDVEGAELLVLRGAVDTLKTYSPHVWVSIHPDLGERDYKIRAEQVHAFMESVGYRGEHLSTDHEEHWFFAPKAAR